MVKQKLPCAEKNCKSKMTLIKNKDNILGYSCLEKPDEHNFRYNITRKKWGKIILKTKLIVYYNKNPCEEPLIETPSFGDELEKMLLAAVQESENISNLTEIKGIGPKRSQELERAGIKTVSGLVKRSPKHLAKKTGIPITKISKWIIEADKLTN